MDIATENPPFHSRVVNLSAKGWGWVDFVRSINAVTLFGTNFGELLRPFGDFCKYWQEVPKNEEYMAVCASDLYWVAEQSGKMNDANGSTRSSLPLVGKIHWHKPHIKFEPCNCKQDDRVHCDRVQVLFPSDFSWTRSKNYPGKLSNDDAGAVIFGHSLTCPLKWSDEGGPPEEVASGENDFSITATSGLETGENNPMSDVKSFKVARDTR